jgi:hypothetical protein
MRLNQYFLTGNVVAQIPGRFTTFRRYAGANGKQKR